MRVHLFPLVTFGRGGRQEDARPWWELYRGHKPIVVGHKDYTGNGQPFVWRDRV